MIRVFDLRFGANEDNTTFILSLGGDPIAQLDTETPMSRLDALRAIFRSPMSGDPALPSQPYRLTWENRA